MSEWLVRSFPKALKKATPAPVTRPRRIARGWKPYLTGTRCGLCIAPFSIEEHDDGGPEIIVTYTCPKCHVIHTIKIGREYFKA